MADPIVAPYGSWRSPITSDLIAESTVAIMEVMVDGSDTYWVELRPADQGRSVIVRRDADGRVTDVTPPPFSACTQVHEYGGGAFLPKSGTVFFSNRADQRIYRQDLGTAPTPLTPAGGRRFADAVIDEPRDRLICVCEDHDSGPGGPANSLVAVSLADGNRISTIASGYDFYASPRLSGDKLAWLSWNNPLMPWVGTELWTADLGQDGRIANPQQVAGGPEESVFQPEWSPDGLLYFVTDRNGWWNLHRLVSGRIEPVLEMQADFGRPQWGFRLTTYAFESAARIACIFGRKGVWEVGLLDVDTGRLTPIASEYTYFSSIQTLPGRIVVHASGPKQPMAIVAIDAATRAHQVLRSSSDAPEEIKKYFSVPQAIEFPTLYPQEEATQFDVNARSFGFFYPPYNPDYLPPSGELSPLLVRCHGGPTWEASSGLQYAVQFWTSRGFAVLDVNYGGSTGFGREFRNRIRGKWGIVDVLDCIHGAKHLAEERLVDRGRIAIMGGSAGGFTALSAVTFHDFFQTAAVSYGVSDLEMLRQDTHKLESRYMDWLIGPYPERRDLYVARSPVHHAERISVPLILFQGADDPVVPPSQAERIVDALRAKGLPFGYLLFHGEQHGFRRSENIKRSLDATLIFFSVWLTRSGLRF